MGISFPERLDKLVTIGATAQGLGSLKFPYELMFEYEFLFNIAMDILYRKAYLDSNPEPEWEVFRAKMFDLWTAECYFSPQPREECMAPLATVASEVLVMAGEREMIREEHTEAIHEHLPGSELLFIPGGTHFVMQEKPEEVNAAILDFLQ
jgi:pimeloyl-ACP methyl ester carboxylesterase